MILSNNFLSSGSFSSKNPKGVLPHLCDKNFTSYFSELTNALATSLALAPYPENVSKGQLTTI